MPPMLSDDESDSIDVPDQIPARAKAPVKVEDVKEEEDEDDDDAEADEYRVERILKHDFMKDGTTVYQIKWLGYDDEADLTWEPVENLENAKDILETYHKKIGGEPVFQDKPKSSSKKKGTAKGAKRTASNAFPESPAPASTGASKKRGRQSASNGISAEDHLVTNKRELPVGSWEEHITRVTSIVEEEVTEKVGKSGREKDRKELTGLLEWTNDGRKTQHKLKVLRQKCPQKLLDYYEQHLVFNP